MNKVESTPTNISMRIKRRLTSLYDDSPSVFNFGKMCDLNEKEIKTSLIFDEDSSDSGFSEECKQKLFENSFTTKFDEKNLTNSYIEESINQIQQDSASKRMRFMQNENTVSTNCIDIQNLLEEDDRAHTLIGDKSKTNVLPTLQNSKHRDLASISSHTLADLITGKYKNEVERYVIIDARYPYEFEGGHIDCAKNLYLKENLFDYLFKQPIQLEDNSKRLVIIFHCEFSSERGPRLMREIREKDRSLNKNCYPNLYYPEMYLLEGGYKNFFETYSECCLPKAYKPMLHDDHRNDLKFFRKKSKSWELENRRSKLCKSKLDFY